MSSSKNFYNEICQLYRQLHPDKKGNLVDKEVKELYWAGYKAGTIDIEAVMKELKGKLAQKKEAAMKYEVQTGFFWIQTSKL